MIAERRAEAEVQAMSAELPGEPLVIYLDEAVAHLSEYEPRAPFADTLAGDPAFILYTSGTTKEPKGVVQTHGWTYAKRMQAEHWLDAQPGDLVWCTAGTGWAKSIWNVLLGPWSCGAEIVLHEGPFDAQERFDMIERLGVTVLCQAPTEYRLMAKLDELDRFDLSRVRHAVVGRRASQSGGDQGLPGAVRRHHLRRLRTDREHAARGQRCHDACPSGFDGPADPRSRRRCDRRERQPSRRGVEGDIALRGRPPTLFAGYWERPRRPRRRSAETGT